jgi:hypothetical protein
LLQQDQWLDVEVQGPKEARAKAVITYRLKLPKSLYPRMPQINWTVYGGTIIEGQGTDVIKVKPGGPRIVAHAELNALATGPPMQVAYATSITDWPVPNMPPIVSAFAEITEILLACPDDGAPCEPTINPIVPVTVAASDPEGDVLLYTWSAPGRIVGEGSEQVWDLSGVAPGEHVASVEVEDGNGGTVSATVVVSVKACKTCTRPDPTAIVGVVKDSAGKALPNATVKATLARGGPSYGVSGPEGRYTIRYLKIGDYSVTASGTCCKKGTKTTKLRSPGDQVLVDFDLVKRQ